MYKLYYILHIIKKNSYFKNKNKVKIKTVYKLIKKSI